MGLYFTDAEEGTFNDNCKIVQTLLNMSGGDSSNWAQPLLITIEAGEDHKFLELWEVFKKAFLVNFGNPVKKDKAIRELNSLVQTTSVSNNATQFRNLAQEVDWNREALVDKFKLGLKPDVQQELRRGNLYIENVEKGTLEEWITQAGKIDDIQEQGSNQSSWAPRNQGANTNKNTQGSSKNAGTTGKPKNPVRVPQAEKNQRRAAGLCLRCGKPGHVLVDCQGDWTYSEKKVQGKAGKEKD
ncbi:hypothetical protein FRC12_001876 [Ceratobasidium sp. 428]|nr:hypothetical protein FRC12_001876 [Ceratobasidium sp. 428]